MQYTAKRDELLEAAGEVFANIATGVLRVRVNHKYPLSQASQAHLDLEGRKTTGSIVLIPDGVELWVHLFLSVCTWDEIENIIKARHVY